jgi:hypothetical protein
MACKQQQPQTTVEVLTGGEHVFATIANEDDAEKQSA